MTFRNFKAYDNVQGTKLDSSITAIETILGLRSGDGDSFPVTYNGACSSAGTSTVLNDTGIGTVLSGLDVDDEIWIYNVTDQSSAKIIAINADSVTTTALVGGSDNTWGAGDKWVINSFVATLAKKDSVTGVVTQYEEILVDYRDGDTLYVNTSGRGYNGTTPASFDADDYCELLCTAPVVDEIQKSVACGFGLIHNLDNNKLEKDGSMAFTGNVDFGNNRGINCSDPVNGQDVVTKNWVENSLTGFDAHQLYPRPVYPEYNIDDKPLINDNTTMRFLLLDIPWKMSMTKFAIKTDTVTTAGSLDIGFYSADGSSLLAWTTTPTLSSTVTVYEVNLAYNFTPGQYYVAMVGNESSIDIDLIAWRLFGGCPSFSGERILSGTQTVTAGTLPSSFDPTSGTFVLDNLLITLLT